MMFDISNQYWTAQKINYFLCRWYLFERELNTQDANKLAMIKSFFFRLSYLSDQQRDFLAYIYYHPETTRPKHTIKETAQHFHITASKAQRIKIGILAIMKIPRELPKGVKPKASEQEIERNKVIAKLFDELQAFHSTDTEQLPS